MPNAFSTAFRRAAATCGVALSVATAAFAQGPPPKVEFDEAIRRALDQNPTVAEATTNIMRAEALLQQARAFTLPLVSVGVTNATLDNARGFEGSVTQPRNQFSFAASASVPILSLARWATIDQSRDQIEVATRSTTDVRQSIAVAAASAYLSVIAARRQVEVDERALETARAHLDYAQKRFEGGAGSRLNQLRAAQEAASDQSRLEATRLALRTAQEALGVVLAASGPVDAGSEPVFDTTAPGSEAEWIAARTDLQFQTAVQRAAERVVRDSWKDNVPTAAVSFDPLYLTPSGIFQPSRTWRLSISMTHALFEGGQRRANARLREVNRDQASLAFTGLQIQARSEVRLAQEAVQALDRALAGARQAAEHAMEVVKITTAAFEVGATTNLEVIDAQRSARDAETRSAQAEDAVRRAKLDLLVALGRFPK
ncbi:MAG TPA: TolC family protein [Vicinamibacterales bacterium]|nr:TolC family protein [Vicinamibacterales bacterium]